MYKKINKNIILNSDNLNELFANIQKKGYKLYGPTIKESAIIYDEIDSASELPIGWTDVQEAGSYRLEKRNDNAYFGYNVGPHSWKKFLFPPKQKLWEASLDKNGFQIKEENYKSQKRAFIGVKACEIAAIKIQDTVFIEGEYINPIYKENRENVLIIATNCTQAGNTCFCTSMNSGPKAKSNFDLAITEIIDEKRHDFLIEYGSKIGENIIKDISHIEAREEDIKLSNKLIDNAAKQMGRKLDTENIKKVFYDNYESTNWDEVASKCLACANCTMVCPTCFCSSVEDITDITGEHAERWERWDSCFTLDFSHIHGGNVRSSISSRYRQWITHKLATWIDQFDTSGCVGCGRCITWCPVGIDITKEAEALRNGGLKK